MKKTTFVFLMFVIIAFLFSLYKPQNVENNVHKAEECSYQKVEILDFIGEYKITYYCPCELCCGEYGIDRPKDESGNDIVYTASGDIAENNVTVACSDDIPFGTKLRIEFDDGSFGYYICQDRGGAIKGKRIDIYISNHEKCLQKGIDIANVYIVDYDLIKI